MLRLFDFKCSKCEKIEVDVNVNDTANIKIVCCDEDMRRLPPGTKMKNRQKPGSGWRK